MSSPYNQSYERATIGSEIERNKGLDIQGRWDWMVSKEQSNAIIFQAKEDARIRAKEAEAQITMNREALAVRKLETMNELRGRIIDARVERMHAVAAQTAAQAQVEKAQAQTLRSQATFDRVHLREDRLSNRDSNQYAVSPWDFRGMG